MVALGEVVTLLETWFPPDTAQSWDRIGLVSGDLGQEVTRVHLAVDPTQSVITEALDAGADLLVVHHPLLLRGVHSVAATSAKGRAVRALVTGELALHVAHTNADVAEGGVNDALAEALGLSDVQPLAIEEEQPLGRVGELPAGLSLRAFAERLGEVLPEAAAGIRVSGDPDAQVRRVAVMGGAGDTMFDAARRARADVYVTADLRHHPVLEERETSEGGRPYVVDAGHWATESLWLGALARRLAAELGDRVEVHVSTLRTDPWTFVVGAEGPRGDR